MLGAIKIESTKSPDAPNDATSVRVSRRDMSGGTSITIATIPISAPESLTFSFLDSNVLSGKTYRYSLYPVVGTVEHAPVNIDIKCEFDGIFVSDITGTYMASLDLSFVSKKNFPTSYVQPLASKYPHSVRNGSANYFTGSMSGLFTTYTDMCVPDLSAMHAYKEQVLEMLSNGHVKVLRTYDGHGWLVSVDGEASRDSDRFMYADTIAFNWTEVGVMPSTGVVML